MLEIYDQRTNNLETPTGMEDKEIHFSWKLRSDRYDVMQESYQLKVYEAAGNKLMWDTGLVVSDRTYGIRYEGPELQHKGQYIWELSISDNVGEMAEAADIFEIGIGTDQWIAKWVTSPFKHRYTAIESIPVDELLGMFAKVDSPDKKKSDERELYPAEYYRKSLLIGEKKIKYARLYATAHGIFEIYLNGENIGKNNIFQPGFTSYPKYLEYVTYKVMNLREGDNTLALKVGDGWYRGKFGVLGFGANYGKELAVLFQLEVFYEDGTTNIVTSGEDMMVTEGPIRYSDFMVGERYDARQEIPDWNALACDTTSWKSCRLSEEQEFKNLRGCVSDPVRAVMKKKPIAVITTPEGDTVLDFGQVMVGYVSMEVRAAAGTEIMMEFSEVLDENGNYINNVSGFNRDQTNIYIAKGAEKEKYCPSFTFHGFRYVRITNYPDSVRADDFTAYVLSSDCRQDGTFHCSDPRLNQLQSNIQWSQRGNFLSIPTDCPQRERAGWTGDVFVYCDTAMWNADTLTFYRKWLRNLRAEQFENGLVPIVIPYAPGYEYIQVPMFGTHCSAGWGDVIVYLPYKLYEHYGDISVLEENFDAMCRWMQYVESEAENGVPEDFPENASAERRERQKYLWNTSFHYGDWLYPSCKGGMFDSAVLTKELAASALYAQSCIVMIEASKILGRKNFEIHYTELLEKIREAYDAEYITEDGYVKNDLQGLYVLTLAMGLASKEKEKKVMERLIAKIHENGDCLDTGFMSIKYLMDVLSKYGHSDMAKTILYQEQCPSWLYEINHNATTIWETWDAVSADEKPSTFSYNHYAFGCIGDWMYRNLLGVRCIEPGYKKFLINPDLKYGLSNAEGSYESANGKIEFKWYQSGIKSIVYELKVPVNTTAEVLVPEIAISSLYINDSAVKCNDRKISLGSGYYKINFMLKEKLLSQID